MQFIRAGYRFLSSEVSGLHAAVYVLALSALFSSILALVRDRLLAHTFGASATLDVYYAAFRIPDLIFVIAGALVSVYILIPELAKRDESSQRRYIDTVIAGFSLFAVAVALVAFAAAPELLGRFFPRFVESGVLGEAVLLTRILLLQPILLGLSNILAAITQIRSRYALYSLSPLLYNLGIILGVTLFYPMWGTAGLAWGVVLGAALHVGIQVPSVFADGFLRTIPLIREPRALLSTVMISIPRALALSLNQIAFLALVSMAALLPAGSIAIFIFAYNLNSVPLAIIGASFSVAAFPTLAKALSLGERDEFISLVATATRYVFFWSVPASFLVLVLRAHIVRVVLGSGAFDWTDTRLTAAAFALLSLSLACQGLLLLLFRAYYAAGRTLVPLVPSAGIASLTVLLAWLGTTVFEVSVLRESAEVFFRVEGLAGSAVLSLAIAFSIATGVGALALVMHFETVFAGYFSLIWRGIGESILAGVVAGFSAYVFLELVSSFHVPSTTLSLFVQGALAGIFAIAMATAAYIVLGNREYAETYTSIAARLWRKKTDEITVVASAEQ